MPQAVVRLTPFERVETLGARVRDQIRHAIMAGLFKPGEKLTLRAVAASLGVSPTPVREALFNLVAEGVLEMGQTNGSIYIPEFDAQKIRELIKVRMSLEGLAAREATVHITDSDLDEIIAFNDQLSAATAAGNYRDLYEYNWKFHFKIYERADMPFLVRTIESCWLRTGAYLNIIYPEFADHDEGDRNHATIIKALQARDPDWVSRAIMHDIETSSMMYYAALAGADARA